MQKSATQRGLCASWQRSFQAKVFTKYPYSPYLQTSFPKSFTLDRNP